MKIIVNGKIEKTQEKSSIYEYLISKKLDPDTMIVEYRDEIINSNRLKEIILKEEDTLELFRIVGGG